MGFEVPLLTCFSSQFLGRARSGDIQLNPICSADEMTPVLGPFLPGLDLRRHWAMLSVEACVCVCTHVCSHNSTQVLRTYRTKLVFLKLRTLGFQVRSCPWHKKPQKQVHGLVFFFFFHISVKYFRKLVMTIVSILDFLSCWVAFISMLRSSLKRCTALFGVQWNIFKINEI